MHPEMEAFLSALKKKPTQNPPNAADAEQLLQALTHLKTSELNINKKDSSTALYHAVKNGYAACLQPLIDMGARVGVSSKNKITPLMLAAQNGDQDCLEILIRNGASLNARDKEGISAIMKAAEEGHLEAVKTLIEKGADLNTRTLDGMTLLDFATLTANPVLFELLIDSGAEPSTLDKNGPSLLNIAIDKITDNPREEMLPILAQLLRANLSTTKDRILELDDFLKDCDQSNPQVLACLKALNTYLQKNPSLAELTELRARLPIYLEQLETLSHQDRQEINTLLLDIPDLRIFSKDLIGLFIDPFNPLHERAEKRWGLKPSDKLDQLKIQELYEGRALSDEDLVAKRLLTEFKSSLSQETWHSRILSFRRGTYIPGGAREINDILAEANNQSGSWITAMTQIRGILHSKTANDSSSHSANKAIYQRLLESLDAKTEGHERLQQSSSAHKTAERTKVFTDPSGHLSEPLEKSSSEAKIANSAPKKPKVG